MWNRFVTICSKRVLLFLLLTFLAAIIFQKNPLRFTNSYSFDGFQKDSEALIIGRIVADDLGIDMKGANMGFVAKGNEFKYPDNIMDAYSIFSEGADKKNITFSPYMSGFGVQGIAFSKIHHLFGLNKLTYLQSINSILLAIVLVSIFFLYRTIYDDRFAAIFLVTMISSPWIVAFARNLFWVPFLWFIPALFAAILYQRTGIMARIVLLLAIIFSVFVKSLAGYEYLSSITLFTCSVFVVAPFFNNGEKKQPINLVMFFLVFAACVIGFVAALLVHAGIRGDSIVSGLQNIFEQDVKRRTYGDPSLFIGKIEPQLKASLESSPFSVIKTYVLDWNTDLIAWLPGKLFRILVGISIVGLIYKFYTKHKTRQRDLVIFAFFFIVPVSWYVLAKGHSFIHTHINYVLWYFGFVQALIYITFNTATLFSLRFLEWAKTADVKDF